MKQLIPSWWFEQWARERREAEQRLEDIKRRMDKPHVDVWTNEGGR